MAAYLIEKGSSRYELSRGRVGVRSPVEVLADRASAEALLNCYVREIAIPAGEIQLVPCATGALELWVSLSAQGGRIEARVAAASTTGNYRFEPEALRYREGHKGHEGQECKAVRELPGTELFDLMVAELTARYGGEPHPAFRAQVGNSFRVQETLLARPVRELGSALVGPERVFVRSEQSLRYGHRFHPAPKSREGLREEPSAGQWEELGSDELSRFSPELGARFAFHYFSLPEAWVDGETLSGEPIVKFLAEDAPSELRVGAGRVALPVHPWQARYVSELPEARELFAQGVLVDLGPAGYEAYPTASVRTVYRPGSRHFHKLSLSFRITNCLRRNARPEMQAALLVSRLLERLGPEAGLASGATRVLREPAYATIRSPHEALSSAFGTVFREGFLADLPEGSEPVVAADPFSGRPGGAPGANRAGYWLSELAEVRGLDRHQACVLWFGVYLDLLLTPVLKLFFEHGVMCEPHLQNVVFVVQGGLPTQVLIRDLDNFKVVEGTALSRMLPSLEGSDPQAVSEMTASFEACWNRLQYTLLVNHLAEAVPAMVSQAGGESRLETALWGTLREKLAAIEARLSRGTSLPEARAALRELLAGAAWPAKGNLKTRFHKTKDRDAEYFAVPSPLASSPSAERWIG